MFEKVINHQVLIELRQIESKEGIKYYVMMCINTPLAVCNQEF
jgi:hypothetical protein